MYNLYLREQGCEDSWLFFEAKRDPRAEPFEEQCVKEMFTFKKRKYLNKGEKGN
jgi:hypothetical protein